MISIFEILAHLALSLVPALAAAPDSGRTFRFPLDGLLAGEVAPEKLHPLEAWIRDRLPKENPRVERVSFLHTTWRRFEAGGAPAAPITTYELEVEGTYAFNPNAVESFMFGFFVNATRTVRLHATVVERRRPRDGGPLRAEVVLLEEHDWRRQRAEAERIAAAGSAEDGRVIGEDHLDARSGERVHLVTGEDVAYVADFELTQTGESLIADPVIETLRDGVLLEVTPILHPDGVNVTLDVTVTIADLVRPMRTVETTLAGSTMTFQVPEVRQVRWDSGPLDIPLESAQFVVRGLFSPDAEPERDREIEVYLFARTVESPAPADRAPGRIVAVDLAAGAIVAIFDSPRATALGERLEVVRMGQTVGALEVDRVEGSTVICRRVDGAPPKAGDGLR